MSEWNEFSERLFQVLLELGERSYLIVCGRDDGVFRMQCVAESDLLVVQCRITNAELKNPAAVKVLRDAGCVPGEPDGDYWSHDMELPAASAAYTRLVEDIVVVMREVQGVASPEELGYRAWRDPERIPAGQVYYDEDVEALDPGENPLVLDLGIPIVN